MKRLCLLIAALLVAGCASMTLPPRNLSGPINASAPQNDGLLVGFVADSQLQTRSNYALVRGYRGAIEDWAENVAIRPPALDWAARAMLRAQLGSLHDKGSRAIFYLGDGANNGCFDEFASGFSPADSSVKDNDLGLLGLLAQFRDEKDIPVYFILGNHDLLGAGSTSNQWRREAFCEDVKAGRNRPLPKADVIALVEEFNRGNDRFAPTWKYASSFHPTHTKELCGTTPANHHVAWGCYLAGRVDTVSQAGVPVQFLLIDTNDWANIVRFRIGRYEQLGFWGAMSVGEPWNEVPSQIGWFSKHAGDMVPMRVALTHYNVEKLQKKLPIVGVLSSLSRHMADLFTVEGTPRTARQIGAYFISGHTHTPTPGVAGQVFSVGCRRSGCEPLQHLYVTELNIGSTTDYSSYATLAELRPSRSSPGEIRFQRVESEPQGCDDVYRDVQTRTFPRAFMGHQIGWEALGISIERPRNYRRFRFEDLLDLWANLDDYAGENGHRATCIGKFAAQIETLGR